MWKSISRKDIVSGVPQGSVLGPLHLYLFINYIFYFIKDSNICNYADDNTLFFADPNVEKIIHNLEIEIKILVDLFKNNSLYSMRIRRQQFLVLVRVVLILEIKKLLNVKIVNFLALPLTKMLTW